MQCKTKILAGVVVFLVLESSLSCYYYRVHDTVQKSSPVVVALGQTKDPDPWVKNKIQQYTLFGSFWTQNQTICAKPPCVVRRGPKYVIPPLHPFIPSVPSHQ